MLIEIIVTVFVVGFVAVAAFGHVLLAQALLAPEGGEKPARQREADTVIDTAETHPQAQLRKVA